MDYSDSQVFKISKISAVDQICDRIKRMLIDGTYKVGDKLPPESVLADTFGVNRLTVRGALQKLSAYGIVESRVGDGTYVKEFSPLYWLRETQDFLISSDRLHEVYELRRVLEIECCRLAISRASAEEINQLEKYTSEYDTLRKKLLHDQETTQEINQVVFDSLLNTDMLFHEQIYLMSHNKTFYELFLSFKSYVRASISEQLRHRVLHESINLYDNHIVIYEGILNHDFKKCRVAYSKILEDEFLNA